MRPGPFFALRHPERRDTVATMLAATIEQLRWTALEAHDASGYFAAMYARVTDRVQRAIDDGRFGDGERMAHFARTFADWYLGPRAGMRERPECWQIADDAAGEPRLLIVQHLLLGVNAHVNHDLPQVVVELTAGTRVPVEALRADFDAINDILAETQPAILRDLGRASGWTQLAAAAGGGRVFNFSLDRARDEAWRTAVRLHRLDPATRIVDAGELDSAVTGLSQLITAPRRPLRWLLRIPRWLEHDDPREVTTRLLGHLA